MKSYKDTSLHFYPINLNIKDKLCLVIWGGKVAERKIKTILHYDGRVRVISPQLTEKLADMAQRGEIEYIKEKYRFDHLKDGFLVYAATSDRKTNAQIAEDGKRSGFLVNVCDSLEESAFILPAVLRENEVIISVSTNGSSPTIAVMIRNKMKDILQTKTI